jgi:hypothetical protein
MLFLIPIFEVKEDIKKNCKETLIHIYGWTGTITVVLAYGLTSFDSEEYLLIDILNLYGSLSIGYTCYRSRVWQAFVCEIIWFSIGIYSLIKNISDEGGISCH